MPGFAASEPSTPGTTAYYDELVVDEQLSHAAREREGVRALDLEIDSRQEPHELRSVHELDVSWIRAVPDLLRRDQQ